MVCKWDVRKWDLYEIMFWKQNVQKTETINHNYENDKCRCCLCEENFDKDGENEKEKKIQFLRVLVS